MKKLFVLLIFVLVLVLSFAACTSNKTESVPKTDTTKKAEKVDVTEKTEEKAQPESCSFEAQYIRTNGYHEDVKYPVVTLICSTDELRAYYEANRDKYSLERRTGTIYSDSTIGFLDACDKYDEKYFENQILVMVLLEEGSGSIRHEVEGVSTLDGEMIVEIKTLVPEAGTEDMAEWHILIEPEAGVDVKDADSITVLLNGKDVTEKTEEIFYEKGFGNISVTLKEGWEYDISDDEGSVEFSVNIYPLGHEKNKLRIGFYELFGVCGTGLVGEEFTIGRYNARMGTYDGGEVWDFINILGTYGDYAIINDGKAWWSEYGDEAMQILATLKVGEGYIDEAEAVRIARQKAGSTYEAAEVDFYFCEGLWRITVAGENTNGEKATFVINNRGNIIKIIEGVRDDFIEMPEPEKPVIYLYPEEETKVDVKLSLNGRFTCTYPAYNNGWSVVASPDGTLTDESGQTYNYLYWEGVTRAEYDFSKGFCIKGSDTAKFFEYALPKLGLNRREANEFIVYWLPLLEKNEYNLISFQNEAYTESARLDITPAPDTLIRVFMAYKALDEYVEIEEQILSSPEREGFTVIEWGGAEVK